MYRSTAHKSDHELVVSTFCFQIKAKRRQAGGKRYRTTNLPSSFKASYQDALQNTTLILDQDDANVPWNSFKQSIQKACEVLPAAPKSSDPDWITDEVCNLPRTKQKAWIALKNATSDDFPLPQRQV